jgi:hypothetical protein
VDYIDLRMPAYGGRLFDPDRFPFLEGRTPGTSWRDTPAAPLLIDNRTVLHLLNALQYLQVRLPGGSAEPRLLPGPGIRGRQSPRPLLPRHLAQFRPLRILSQHGRRLLQRLRPVQRLPRRLPRHQMVCASELANSRPGMRIVVRVQARISTTF